MECDEVAWHVIACDGCTLDKARQLMLHVRYELGRLNFEYLSQGSEQYGCGSKLNRRGYAGVGPCFHLPGFHFGAGF